MFPLYACIILFKCESLNDYFQVFQKNPMRDNPESENGTNSANTESHGHPNTALLHTIILFSTFGIAIGLRLFQETRYFSPPVSIKYF